MAEAGRPLPLSPLRGGVEGEEAALHTRVYSQEGGLGAAVQRGVQEAPEGCPLRQPQVGVQAPGGPLHAGGALFKRVLEDLDRGRPPLAVVEVGREERMLYSLSPTPPPRAISRSILWEQLESNLYMLEGEVEDLRRSLVR
ncbi:hypothetical protein [Aeropyrum camini]|uniref:hypothetical protein n=1 Tax=Aeropyrum camini TaxID=229980 RepID=UPI0007885C7C|nr:hypothetical protein [Aeropyrum camini]